MADVDITSLSVEISAESQGAELNINKLANAIANLRTKGNVSGVCDSLDRLSSSISKLKDSSKGIGSIFKNLEKISSISVSGIDFTGLSGKLESLKSELQPLQNIDTSGLKAVGSAMNAIAKIPSINDKLDAKVLDGFKTACDSISKSLTPLASQLDKVGNAFAKLPPQLSKVVTQANRVTAANEKQRKSYLSLSNQVNAFMRNMAKLVSLKAIATYLGEAAANFNNYYEAANLFGVSMKEMTGEASDFIDKMETLLGIDPTEAMNNMATIQGFTTSFGVASDKAYILSKNLTQLGYDLSSLKNISVAESFTKIQAAISGELEPIRRLGVDLSQARLQQELLSLGFTQSVSSLSQADKAILRYIAIMKQTTDAQGDFARTLDSPANMIRVLQAQFNSLARSVGSVLYPALKSILPPLIAAVELVKELVQALASLMGVKVEFPDFKGNSSAVADTSDALDNAATSAKKAQKALKDYTMGFDELNIINPTQDTGSSGSGSSGGASGNILGDVDLSQYDMFAEYVGNQVESIKEKLKGLLPTIASIGAAFAAWQISKVLLDALDKIKNFTINAKIDFSWTSVGLLAFIADMNEFKKYLDDFLKNGPTFKNVAGMISEFAGMMGDALIALGNLKLGGALKIVQGVGEIIIAIKDIADNGLNWDNATTAIRGLTNVAIGIGAFTGHLKVAGWALAIQGFTSIIQEIANNWDAIKNGDWSGVDKATLVIGALEVFGGIATALGVFSKLKAVKESTESVQSVKTVADATHGVSNATSSLSPNLTSLAKNLAVGVAIVAEVSAAAVLFAGAIVVLGNELKAAGDAWQPVITNAKEVAEAVGLGSAALVTVGAATAVIGSAGGVPLATNIGIGTAILAEVGAAAVLFEAEVWAVGTGLDKIQQAWTPVTQNAPAVKTALVAGTALLVAVGAATAAIGAATVASAGTIPIAIGLGTAVLVECAGAFVALTDSISDVADEMTQKLYPSLKGLNAKLPSIKEGMSDLTGYLKDFASELSSYTKSMGSVTWSSIVSNFQKLFVGNPIGSLAKDVGEIYEESKTLNNKLSSANPELSKAVRLLTDYSSLMGQLKMLTEENGNIKLATDIFTNLKTAGEKLVTGFISGIDSKLSDLNSEIEKVQEATLKIGSNESEFEAAGANLMKGFVRGIKGERESTYKEVAEIGKKVLETFKTSLDEHSPSKATQQAGEYFDEGFAIGLNAALNVVEEALQNVVNAATNAGQQFIDSGAEIGQKFIDNLDEKLNSQWQKIENSLSSDFLGSIKTLGDTIKNGDLEKLGTWAASYFYHAMDDEQKKQIKAIAENSLKWLTQGLSGAWQSISRLASSFIGKLVPATQSATIAQLGLNTAMDANVVLFIISVIGMLVGAIINFSKTNDDVASDFTEVWGTVSDVFSYIFQGILYIMGWYVQGFVNIINVLIGAYNLVAKLWGGHMDYVENPVFEWAEKVGEDRKKAQEERKKIAKEKKSGNVPGTSESENAEPTATSYTSSSVTVDFDEQEMREAVYNGTYNAMLDIVQRYGDQISGGKELKIYLDGKQLTASVEKTQNERGQSVMGTEAYSY